MLCPYCNNEAKWVSNEAVYGRRYGKSYMIWLCVPCNAYVGCHKNTQRPLGRMANQELRDWRVQAHGAFDPLWKAGRMTRDKAYRLLNGAFGKEVHIGNSDIETCKRIIEVVKQL